jgi:hypothetical protein
VNRFVDKGGVLFMVKGKRKNWSKVAVSRLRTVCSVWLHNLHNCPSGLEKEVKVLFGPVLLDFRKSIAFWKDPRPRPFVLLVSTT